MKWIRCRSRARFALTQILAGLLGLGLGWTRLSDAQVAAPAAAPTILQAPDQFFTRGEVRLRYREAGQGEPVVLLHGYTQRIELMQDLADSLSPGFRVIVFDQRGFGESSKFSDPARYGRGMTADVIGLLDHLGIRRAHLVGHSMGALVAASAAERHPDRVASASLIAGPFYPDSAQFARMAEPWIGALERGEGLVEFGKWILPGIPDSIMVAFNAQIMAMNDLGSLIAAFRSMGGLVPTRQPGRSTRILIAVGTGDPLLPQSQGLKARWTGARYLELPGVNHDAIRAHGQVVQAIREIVPSRP